MSVGKDVDLERCVCSISTSVHGARTPPTTHKPSREYAIALQNFNGSSMLLDVEIHEVNGDIYLNTAKEQICQILYKSWYQRLSEKLFTFLIVGTAKVQQVLRYGPTPSASGTPASLPTFTPVYFTDFRRCLLLTEAFHNPRLYVRNADHQLGELLKVSTSHDADLAGKQIIVVRKVIDKAKVAWLLVLLLGISPVLGVAVGVCSHSAEAGIGVSAGVFALASFTQGIVAWIQG